MFVKLYLIALPVFLVLDMVWLAVVAKNFYRQQIGFLLRANVNWLAAIIFYLVFIAGLVAFVIVPARQVDSRLRPLLYGALFGLVTYATYDLTNLATVKDWPLLVTLVDLAWGMVLSMAVSFITCFIASKTGS